MDSEPAIFSSFPKLDKMGFGYKTQCFWFTKRSGLVLHFSPPTLPKGQYRAQGYDRPFRRLPG